MTQRALTHLMFAGQASAALELYSATFADFRIVSIERYGTGEAGPAGSVKQAEAALGDHHIIVIDSPVRHDFTFTPAISLFVNCATEGELDRAFAVLASEGKTFMPIGNYGFSRRFGWCSDRFGVSWQLNLP